MASDTGACEAESMMCACDTEELKNSIISEVSADLTIKNKWDRLYMNAGMWMRAPWHVTIGPIRHQKHTQMGALQKKWQRGSRTTNLQEIRLPMLNVQGSHVSSSSYFDSHVSIFPHMLRRWGFQRIWTPATRISSPIGSPDFLWMRTEMIQDGSGLTRRCKAADGGSSL